MVMLYYEDNRANAPLLQNHVLFVHVIRHLYYIFKHVTPTKMLGLRPLLKNHANRGVALISS